MSRFPAALQQYLVALRALVLMTLVLGLAYPLVVTGIAQAVDAGRANGQIVSAAGAPVGSDLLGQSFADADGRPLPQWFQSRPSANGYDAKSSGASNLGPSDPGLAATIEQRRIDIAAFDSVPGHEIDPADVPADAVTASASGLDPQISVAYADQQVRRVAAARALSIDTVQGLVRRHTEGRPLGFLGEPGVNLLALNIDLAGLR